MRIVFFVSGGGGNLNCGIALQKQLPGKIEISLVIADRMNTKAEEIARQAGIPVVAYDFEQQAGVYKECRKTEALYRQYQQQAELFHDRVLEDIIAHEAVHGRFDLAVLSYRRIIRGKLLNYFDGRMINQHPGDLTEMCSREGTKRLLTGYDPVLKALKYGKRNTRTSTIMVRDGIDTGEILARGPEVAFDEPAPTRQNADLHELKQKEQSDWPVLRFVLEGIAAGRFSISEKPFFNDGCRQVLYDSVVLPYGGFDMKYA